MTLSITFPPPWRGHSMTSATTPRQQLVTAVSLRLCSIRWTDGGASSRAATRRAVRSTRELRSANAVWSICAEVTGNCTMSGSVLQPMANRNQPSALASVYALASSPERITLIRRAYQFPLSPALSCLRRGNPCRIPIPGSAILASRCSLQPAQDIRGWPPARDLSVFMTWRSVAGCARESVCDASPQHRTSRRRPARRRRAPRARPGNISLAESVASTASVLCTASRIENPGGSWLPTSVDLE